jgi:spore germination protein YaaH
MRAPAVVIAVAALLPQAAVPMRRHFYLVDEPDSLVSLQRNRASIDVVSPVWFTFTKAGKVESRVDTAVVEWAATHKLPLIPLFVNEGFRPETARRLLRDEPLQSAVIQELAQLAAARRFAGLQLDFEGLAVEERGAYASFVARFADTMQRLRMELSVAVPAPLAPSADPVSGHWPANEHAAAFDYLLLGKAADSLSVMTYDQHTSPERPGPIAGYAWVDASVRKVLEQVPARKIMLGLALYHRRWNAANVTAGAYLEARGLAVEKSAQINFDNVHREANFRFVEGDIPNTVWFSNAQSLRSRVDLIGKYKLAGFSAWRLGQEDPVVWLGVFAPRRVANSLRAE